jgi:hypothetical protein
MKSVQHPPGDGFCRLSFWQTIARRFPEERSCLASFLAYHGAEVLNGVKPGNLINIPAHHPCSKNLVALWHHHGASLLTGSGLVAKVLAARRNSLLVYLYCRDSVENLLNQGKVRNFLKKAGYGDFSDCEAALTELQCRMRQGGFPHEIGLFLGYPLKDVAGFLGWAKLPVSGQDAWKIYGDPRKSLELAACHRDCRCRMAKRLHRVTDPSLCLRRKGHSPAAVSTWRQAG